MENPTFIQQLRKIIPIPSIAWVTAALRLDPILWASLEETEFSRTALEQCGAVIQAWSPANLALLAMRLHNTPAIPACSDLQADIQIMLNDELRVIAGQKYETILGQPHTTSLPQEPDYSSTSGRLAQAGLLALAMRERCRVLGTWEGLVNELHQAVKSDMSLTDVWQTPVACLPGMLPDQNELFMSLLGTDFTSEMIDLVLHAILTQPQPPEEHTGILRNLISQLDLSQAIDFTSRLSQINPDFALKLSQPLMDASEWEAKQPVADQPNTALDEAVRLENVIRQIQGYRIANRPEPILSAAVAAQGTIQKVQAKLAAEKAWAASAQGDLEGCLSSWQQAMDHDLAEARYRGEYCLDLLQADQIEEAGKYLEQITQADEQPSGLLLYAYALYQQKTNQLEKALETTQKACQVLTSRNPSAGQRALQPYASRLASLCLDLGLPQEAVQTAKAALTERQNDPELHALRGKCELASGNLPGAVQALHLAVALAPEHVDYRRTLAEYLELGQAYDEALAERFSIVQSQPDQLTGDLHNFAQCALWAGQPSQAASACEQVLSANPEDGLAHAILGQALAALGDPQNALQHLSQATAIKPDYAPAWQQLAKLQHASGAGSKAIETLRAAAQAVPNAAEIYLALGEAYQADWDGLGHPSPTQALSMFQQASSLAGRGKTHPDIAAQIALCLGQTLQQLGHIWEAHQALAPAYQQTPAHPGLAYAYATNLLALDQPQKALEPLTKLLATQPTQPGPYIAYAKALLAVKGDTDKVMHALQAALALDASLVEARGLLAEAAAASGDYKAALLAYQEALETNLVENPEWSTRLSLGLGRVALALQQPDIAVAALQEASQADPENVQIHHLLTEAFQASGLVDNAVQSALTTLRLSPDNAEQLTWFAETMMDLLQKKNSTAQATLPEAGNPDTSDYAVLQAAVMNAVSRAIQLAPQRPDLLVRLGVVQTWAGDLAGAVQTFQAVIVLQDCSVEVLHQAGRNLLQLHDTPNAVIALERAMRQQGDQVFESCASGSLALDLMHAYRQNGDVQSALGILDHVLAVTPTDLSLHQIKINLLLELGRHAEALEGLQKALALPIDPVKQQDMRLQAATTLRSLGRLPEALSYVEEWLANTNALSSEAVSLSARTLAASLALAMLQPEKARQLLGSISNEQFTAANSPALNNNPLMEGDSSCLYDYACLKCEIALGFNDIKAAEDALLLANKAIKPEKSHTRFLALQSCILLHQGDRQKAKDLLQEALASNEQPDPQNDRYSRAAIEQALAGAALALGHWDSATYLFRKACEELPNEAFTHLQLARALTLRAEIQRLSQTVEVIKHAPGLASLSDHAYHAYQTAIDTAASLCPSSPASEQIIARWRARGQAIFHPNQLSAQALAALSAWPLTPDDVAAQIAVLQQPKQVETEEILQAEEAVQSSRQNTYTNAIQSAHAFPTHPLVAAQLALVLIGDPDHRQDALGVIRQVVEEAQPASENKTPAIYLTADFLEEPVWHAVVAKVAESAGDQALALQAIQMALNVWDDEPRWHSLAARIYRQCADYQTAIHHLEQAVALEPDFIPHSLALGQAYIESTSQDDRLINQAITVLEKARHLAPEQPETWMALARAHQIAQDLSQAACCADQAISLAPDQPQAVVLRAEIALQAGQPQEAHDRLRFLLGEDNAHPVNMGTYDGSLTLELMARSLVELDRNEDALALIEKALPDAKEPLPLLLERTRILHHTQGIETALQVLQELVHVYPSEPLVLGRLAKLMYEGNQKTEAVPMAQRALQAASQSMKEEKRPNLNLIEQAELHLLLGRLLRESGQLDQALYHLNEAIHKDAHLLESYLELGRAHQERRQPNLALQIYKQATLIAPHDPRPYYQAGIALKDSKDYMGAETMLRRAASLAPNDLSIHRQLGAVVALNLVHNRRHMLVSVEDV